MLRIGLLGPGDTSIDTTFNIPDPFVDTSASSSQSMMPMSARPVWFGALWAVLSTASAALSGYHGYKRNNSLGWGIAWFALGGLFPIITPTVAFAQGFGKRKA